MRLYYLLITAFIEGAAVMCVELCSAKMLAPFFGTSIYVWAAVLGVTLSALMTGYYTGGYLSFKYRTTKTVYYIMGAAAIYMMLIPSIIKVIIPATINLSIIPGSLISLIFILFIPLVLFGTISPLLINLINTDKHTSGKSSGTIYAVSTLGGIIATFLIGFYLLPHYGISFCLILFGIIVGLPAVLYFFVKKQYGLLIILVVTNSILGYRFMHAKTAKNILYKSDGILGEIKVIDRSLYNQKTNTYTPFRELMVNNISQTVMDLNNPNNSYWDYVDVLIYNLNNYAKGKKVLLLGLGGGTLYKQLKLNGYDVDVVEIDERIAKVAKDFFQVEKDLNVVIDDARHYLNTANKKYDVIIYDLFHSETPPTHLMTLEAFKELKTKLTDKGLLVINFYGFISGDKGLAARSLYKTLLSNQFDIRLFSTPGSEASRNLLFYCGKSLLGKAKNEIVHNLIYEVDLDLTKAPILIDNKPILEHIYVEAALSWRKGYNKINTKYFIERDIY